MAKPGVHSPLQRVITVQEVLRSTRRDNLGDLADPCNEMLARQRHGSWTRGSMYVRKHELK